MINLKLNTIYCEDCRETMKKMSTNFIDCIVTSPPYFGLRDYGVDRQIGLEESPEKYVEVITDVFNEARRILKKEGTLWLNLGDSYNTNSGGYKLSKEIGISKATAANVLKSKIKTSLLKPKDLIGIPWMVAFALRNSGWYLRQDIIWYKPNHMPESVTDRCTKSHEYIFLMSKSAKYFYDYEAIKVPLRESSIQRLSQNIEEQKGSNRVAGKINGQMKAVGQLTNTIHKTRNSNGQEWQSLDGKANKRSVWIIPTMPFSEAHFATFPMELIADMIKAGCPENGIVYDPFMGSGTTGACALRLNRKFVGSELNPKYVEIAERRINKEYGLFNSK